MLTKYTQKVNERRTMNYQLEKDPIWKETLAVVEYMYSILDEFPEDEKWGTMAHVRSASTYLLYTVAQGIGNGAPTGSEYDWGNALKHLSGLKAMCVLAYKQRFVKIDPTIMVRMDELLKQIDARQDESLKVAKNHEAKDMANWQKRYDLWKKAEVASSKATNVK